MVIFEKVWQLLVETLSRKSHSEECIKTDDDIIKMHKASMLAHKTRQKQTVRFSNGDEVTFSHCDVEFDWSRCKT